MKYLEFGIFISLLDGKYHKAKDLADKFEVSIKSIYRSTNKLAYVGLPITTTAGRNGGILLCEKNFCDTWFFTEDELAYMLNLANSNAKINPTLNGILQEKLKNHIKDKKFEIANNLSGNFFIDSSSWFCLENSYQNQTIIEDAIINHKKLDIFYNQSHRTIDPYCLVYKESNLYLYAFCNYRQDFRLFKISRISNICSLDKLFEKQTIDLSTKPWNKNHSFDKIEIKIQTDLQTKEEIDNWSKTKKIDDNTYSFVAVNNIGLIHKLMEYGNKIRILSPNIIKEKLLLECKSIVDIYA